MRSIYSWLDEYSDSHRHKFNKLVHWICVPVIMFSLLGLLWGLQVPEVIETVFPVFNWAAALVVAALVFYFLLSIKLALGMVVVSAVMLILLFWLDTLPFPLWLISVVLFVAAWLGQFIGHLVEGRKPSFFKDLQFLLIGPLWLLAKIYKRLSIDY